MRLLSFIGIAALMATSAPASAYVRSQENSTGACLFWTTREVPWVLNASDAADPPEQAVAALERSFGAWQDVECSDMSFRMDGFTDRQELGFDDTRHDNLNLLVFRKELCLDVVPAGDRCFAAGDCPEVYGCWDHSAGIIALSTVNYSRQLGFIVDADIEFNGARHRFTTTEATGPPCASPVDTDCVGTDLQNTATHEIGHLLGFDHSRIPQSTMFATASDAETSKRSLEQDDIDAICDVYPAGGPVLTCTPSGGISIAPTGTASNGCGCGAGAGGLVALAALLLAARRRAGKFR